MKTLPDSFDKKGFHHEIAYRDGLEKLAIYKRWKDGQPVHWEVIIIREQKERVMQTPSGPVTLPHAELYPSSEAWGTYGWTLLCWEDAFAKYRTLTKTFESTP